MGTTKRRGGGQRVRLVYTLSYTEITLTESESESESESEGESKKLRRRGSVREQGSEEASK